MLKLLISLFMMIWMSMFLKGMELMLVLFSFLSLVFLNYVDGGMMMYKLGGDLLSMNLFMLSVWMMILMLLASFKEMLYENKYFKFYLFFMLFLLYMCFYSTNLMMFYFFFESILFPIIMMIFNWGNQPERLQAGIYMLMYTLLGSLPLFIIMFMFKDYSLNYLYMEFLKFKTMGLLFFLMMLGFLVKVPMFFLHLWLPKAHVEAPISGSMILASVLLKLGIYGIYRFKMFFLKELMEMSWVLMIISILGSMIVGVMCLFQTDLKALIAYSSVCHMGLVLSGIMSMNFLSSFGSLLLMLGHGLCSSGLFCLGNMLYERFFTRSLLLLKGMNKIFPSVSLWWFLMSVFNMAAPPSMNIFGEIFLMGSLLKLSMMFLFPLMILLFLSAGYSLYLFSYINHGEGWIMWAVNSITAREHLLMYFHFFPLIIWILKMECFESWI
uniref:NADH dehydrogenase subunit 4 n=1 Tax=Ixodes scapularis TaxID=6945 RepID=UPI0022384813|nr:NADH dehydrogenase subunit 4 [Ixodes scapularis]UYB78140.1 NADH dehydrogenase subunit 4 [Ixodes scapularis]UYB78153.1 NADH dehydrogenase subunit 4 [Ixodes scapularis]